MYVIGVHLVIIVYAVKPWFNITIATDESVIPLIVISPSPFVKLVYVIIILKSLLYFNKNNK